ncbi:hypothetical protein [uncultured Fibrobacter sp.]|uniref:hypothetical protein n=1 Tax=uncultured Fibrobacter sp. TaxID=261512 RepID=UPI00280470B8|nr:hypothetical protein [uncultured Fibrobacter sp.]
MSYRDEWLDFPIKWDVLERFYKTVDGGKEKLEKLKNTKELFDAIYNKTEFHYCFHRNKPYRIWVHQEFLHDRREKLNHDFEWNDENKQKLVLFDRHIRDLQNEIYQTFLQTKEHLDGRIAQGFEHYKDYQVEAVIHPGNYWDIQGADELVATLLMGYADWENLCHADTFGEGQSPTSPQDDRSTICAWKEMLYIPEFVENEVTMFLDSLLYDTRLSLYSFWDIANMDPRQFEVKYKVIYYSNNYGYKPKDEE